MCRRTILAVAFCAACTVFTKPNRCKADFVTGLEFWRPGHPTLDQSRVDTDPIMPGIQPAHSGLIGWPVMGVNTDVQDTELANMATRGIGRARFAWVFTQCFGGGMFDELAAKGKTQSMNSASRHDEVSFYPQPVARGGVNRAYSTDYPPPVDAAMSPLSAALIQAVTDPWGPSILAARGAPPAGEFRGLEHPEFYWTNATARRAPECLTRPIAILWSGMPKHKDRDEIVQLCNDLRVKGFGGKQIYVLYRDGFVRGAHPLMPHLTGVGLPAGVPYDVPIRLVSAKKATLNTVFNRLFAAPPFHLLRREAKFVFFFSNDHGYNSHIAPMGAERASDVEYDPYNPDDDGGQGSPWGGGDNVPLDPPFGMFAAGEEEADCGGILAPSGCVPSQVDVNGNGMPDGCEDCQGNGIPDDMDITGGTSQDCNGNLTPDECEASCNDNDMPDECEIALGLVPDLNGNGIPDSCEDCQGNGTPDDMDISSGQSSDCDSDGLPDECENDCNANGIADHCELADQDCNANGYLDECELSWNDSNHDGVVDACVGGCAGIRGDGDGNGVLDARDMQWFVGCHISGDAGCSCADMNNDGVHDSQDVSEFVYYLVGF